MPGRLAVVELARSNAEAYFRKAEQFCDSAAQAYSDQRYDASLLCAVHAGISAADAVCVGLGGRRSRDPDHARVVDLLGSIIGSGRESRERLDQIRALIAQKNRIEYENKRARMNDARDAAQRCERLVAWARAELSKAKLV